MSLPSTYEPRPYGSSTPQRFERCNPSKIHNEIMFNFYPGLPHTACKTLTPLPGHQLYLHTNEHCPIKALVQSNIKIEKYYSGYSLDGMLSH